MVHSEVGSCDPRIDGVNQGRVLSAQEPLWQSDVAVFISVLSTAMTHIQLPLHRVCLFLNNCVEMHVLLKVKNCKGPPQVRSLHAASHNLCPGSLDNDWKDLLIVPAKDNRKATKGSLRNCQNPSGL
jgi:hypothetical protein